ncbi:SDR family NAD(P)-dependent oxidoreductase [Haloferula sp. A504]|uniref:SDR family NAD(P)-dependent oxidoreductase n=1 Tax=Haloferula sp. A504 TaxID=3373601 RepID=UPI0031C0DAE1|nr:SDR family oxidoreductase [Verrucomicrobiaceae bacterium E54]
MSAILHRCALITGASSGIGAEFACQLAPDCGRLVLVARRAGRLEKMAAALAADHPGLEVSTFAADLIDSGDRNRLVAWLAKERLIPDLLVNNAGMGDYGEVATADWPKLEAMIRLNVESLTWLTHAVLPAMIQAGGGAVLNVSSLASLLPIPDFAVYAATKAYVTSFSEALRLEVAEHGIQVTALCPGPVHTEFGDVARREDGAGGPLNEAFYVDCARVVSDGLAGLRRNQARVFPGWKIAGAAVLLSLLPMVAIRGLMGRRPRR